MITAQTLRDHCGEILGRLAAGEPFVITDDGVPVGELTTIPRSHFATREEIRTVLAAAPPIDGRRFRRDLDRIDD